jgi:hypothetical protein
MRALRLPDGNLLIPLLVPDPEDGFALAELGPDHPEVAQWLAVRIRLRIINRRPMRTDPAKPSSASAYGFRALIHLTRRSIELLA